MLGHEVGSGGIGGGIATIGGLIAGAVGANMLESRQEKKYVSRSNLPFQLSGRCLCSIPPVFLCLLTDYRHKERKKGHRHEDDRLQHKDRDDYYNDGHHGRAPASSAGVGGLYGQSDDGSSRQQRRHRSRDDSDSDF